MGSLLSIPRICASRALTTGVTVWHQSLPCTYTFQWGSLGMDVCLVSMPYAAIERPSIALGLLTAELRAAGIDVLARYACLDFAARCGLPAYDAVLGSKTSLFLGEWTFAAAAFPEMAAVDDAYLAACAEELAERVPDVDARALLLGLREEAARFVAELAAEIVAARPRIVGCTSTFQ